MNPTPLYTMLSLLPQLTDEDVVKLVDEIQRTRRVDGRKRKARVDKGAILDLHAQNIRSSEIARRVGCTKAYVCAILKAVGRLHPPQAKPKTVDPVRIRELRQQGKSPKQIAAIVGCAASSVYSALKHAAPTVKGE